MNVWLRTSIICVACFGVAAAIIHGLLSLLPPIDPVTCKNIDSRPVSNGSGMVAQVRKQDCSSMFYFSAQYSVFVRPRTQGNAERNMALSYVLDPDAYRFEYEEPKVAWLRSNLLRVTVRGKVDFVTDQRADIGGVHLRYRFKIIR